MTSFIWIGYISALSVFTGLCLIIAAIAAEVQLVKRKKKTAVVLIAAALVLGTGSSVFFSVVTEHRSPAARSEIYIYKDPENFEDAVGKFQVVQDEQDQIQGFGKLAVKEGGTIKYMDMEFDRQHRMIGGKEALQYETAVNDALKAEWAGNTMIGKSAAIDELNKIREGYDSEITYFDKSLFPRNFLIHNLLTMVLLAIYLAGKIREKRKRASGLDSTKIQDL
ncbi:hypothetical protein [Hominibacterium faecale]|uniref:hypothetical protein n=1 Tax=Hominibacterium faecale TaxID=2839743 RepID=UPI0022B29A1B|nr:hypothetical protein [Hominibacterium faecale]